MKTLKNLLLIGLGSLAIGGCGDKEIKEIQYPYKEAVELIINNGETEFGKRALYFINKGIQYRLIFEFENKRLQVNTRDSRVKEIFRDKGANGLSSFSKDYHGIYLDDKNIVSEIGMKIPEQTKDKYNLLVKNIPRLYEESKSKEKTK